jgi:hypothetical protein
MNDSRKAEAIANARREIARRISRFCQSLTQEEFDRLLDRMAYVHWKYDVFPWIGEAEPPKSNTREFPT